MRHVIACLYLIISILLCYGTLFCSSGLFLDNQTLPKIFFAKFGVSLFCITHCVDRRLYSGLILRSCFSKMIIVVTFSSTILAVQGILQYFHFFLPNPDGTIKGSFDNVAGYSASLCSGFPSCLFIFEKENCKFKKFFFGVSASLIVLAIALSQSRSGTLSVTVIVTMWLVLKAQRKTSVFSWMRLCSFWCLVIVLLCCTKQASTSGRVLIWHCAWNMIKDKPLIGHGAGGFNAHYMNYQARYFRSCSNSQLAILADDVDRPYNEYLFFATEFGIIGIIALSAFIYYCIIKAFSISNLTNRNLVLHNLIVIGVFGMFSYPLTYPFPFLVAAGSIISLLNTAGTINNFAMYIIITCCLAYSAITTKYLFYEEEWKKAALPAAKDTVTEKLSKYNGLFKLLSKNRFFLYNYAAELNKEHRYKESLKICRLCNRYWSTYDLQLIIADNMMHLRCYGQAQVFYYQASYMCPNRFIPLYKLVKLYETMNKKPEALDLARKIIKKPVKIPSLYVSSIKNEMTDLLLNNRCP